MTFSDGDTTITGTINFVVEKPAQTVTVSKTSVTASCPTTTTFTASTNG